jgi:hypothetical protein
LENIIAFPCLDSLSNLVELKIANPREFGHWYARGWSSALTRLEVLSIPPSYSPPLFHLTRLRKLRAFVANDDDDDLLSLPHLTSLQPLGELRGEILSQLTQLVALNLTDSTVQSDRAIFTSLTNLTSLRLNERNPVVTKYLKKRLPLCVVDYGS